MFYEENNELLLNNYGFTYFFEETVLVVQLRLFL